MKKIVLHCCCAPCASGCVERLLAEDWQIILFFANSNIAPETEYRKRLAEVEKLAAIYALELYADTYDHAAWRQAVSGLEREPERGLRCEECFRFSLERTAGFAADHGDLPFTTSLTVSPHKNSNLIFSIGRELPGFLDYNFKKKDGFLRSRILTAQYGFYSQNYCGCEFSASSSPSASSSSSSSAGM